MRLSVEIVLASSPGCASTHRDEDRPLMADESDDACSSDDNAEEEKSELRRHTRAGGQVMQSGW